MFGKERFIQKRKELKLLDTFERFSLYYDQKDKSLWVWDGENFVGISAEDFYKDLMMYIPWKHLFVDGNTENNAKVKEVEI